jgi:hypothetical protein
MFVVPKVYAYIDLECFISLQIDHDPLWKNVFETKKHLNSTFEAQNNPTTGK